jgi:hypothetical protein
MRRRPLRSFFVKSLILFALIYSNAATASPVAHAACPKYLHFADQKFQVSDPEDSFVKLLQVLLQKTPAKEAILKVLREAPEPVNPMDYLGVSESGLQTVSFMTFKNTFTHILAGARESQSAFWQKVSERVGQIAGEIQATAQIRAKTAEETSVLAATYMIRKIENDLKPRSFNGNSVVMEGGRPVLAIEGVGAPALIDLESGRWKRVNDVHGGWNVDMMAARPIRFRGKRAFLSFRNQWIGYGLDGKVIEKTKLPTLGGGIRESFNQASQTVDSSRGSYLIGSNSGDRFQIYDIERGKVVSKQLQLGSKISAAPSGIEASGKSYAVFVEASDRIHQYRNPYYLNVVDLWDEAKPILHRISFKRFPDLGSGAKPALYQANGKAFAAIPADEGFLVFDLAKGTSSYSRYEKTESLKAPWTRGMKTYEVDSIPYGVLRTETFENNITTYYVTVIDLKARKAVLNVETEGRMTDPEPFIYEGKAYLTWGLGEGEVALVDVGKGKVLYVEPVFGANNVKVSATDLVVPFPSQDGFNALVYSEKENILATVHLIGRQNSAIR